MNVGVDNVGTVRSNSLADLGIPSRNGLRLIDMLLYVIQVRALTDSGIQVGVIRSNLSIIMLSIFSSIGSIEPLAGTRIGNYGGYTNYIKLPPLLDNKTIFQIILISAVIA